jgi:D-alanyl-D-alanine carboxypeptidase
MGGRSARERDVMTAQLLEAEFTKLGLGRLAPVIIAMSPLVLDDDEAEAAEATERATESRPQPQAATAGSSGIISVANAQPAVVASLASSPREYGQGDTADQTRSGIPVTGGKWGIQVGAHSSRDNAESQLQSVRTQMRDLLSGAASAVVALDVNGDTFFRVRFGAFTPKKAETLCDQIQKRGVSCLVVTDGAWDQATSRASLPIAVR